MLFPYIQNPPVLPFVSPALGSHMVLQRGRPNTFWGWTDPGSSVTVSLAGRKAAGIAGPDGKWSVQIDPPKVGGPYTVAIDGSQHVELTDVLVGDVWLCTGQSNMEQGITITNGGTEEAAAANDPNLRLFIAPHQTTLEPMKVNGGTWKVCTPETIVQDGWGGFSAVGYHFGKTLRREVGVPIGLVEVVWGGTNAESWASREALQRLGDFDAVFPQIDAAKTVKLQDDQGETLGWQKADFNAADWKAITVPNGFSGLGLDNFDGTAWFRKEIQLTEAQAAGAATISLGAIDDNDTTWINGVQVGAIQSYNTPRNYSVPAGTLHEGRNVVVVRVVDTGQGGGFTGPEDVMSLMLGDGTKVALGGNWMGKAGAGLPVSGPNVPTSLSNGMIEPQVPLGIKGAIWYQGENNAGRAYQYRRILPAMIADWRHRFGQGDFPFYIVSLAAFTPQRTTPGDDEWAELREAQAMTARNVRNSGIAMAIDVGDAADIHPREKKPVGERLARIALAKDYRKRIEYSGPTYKSLTIVGNEARIKFDHADGLMTKGAMPGEFSIAGADRQWHWAMGRIEGDTVVVSSPNVPKPVAVRYAWQSNPTANLYNKAGLPAVPFRTDDWPGRTFGRK